MSVPLLVSRALAAELDELNDRQLRAVLDTDDVVVRAGPGSGKTRTLVAKVGYLLETQVAARRGVAAITYTRHAAREITSRLACLGTQPGWRLSASTVHGWCLNSILRPYGPLVGMPVPGPGSVVDEYSDEWVRLLQRCMDDAGVMGVAQYERSSITRIRRDLAAGNERDPRDPMVRAAQLFDQRMIERGLFDFESMIALALRIIREHPQTGRLIAARFPWVLVDEYQDLGPVLHSLVLALHEETSVKVAAFGDPDQSVMGFIGADPRYLNSLAGHGFLDIPLSFNYRCGQAIIAASHAALNQERPHRACPSRDDPGIIEPVAVAGGLDDHAAMTIGKLSSLTARGVPTHRIAILYPRKGPLLDELLAALDASQHNYVHERDERLPEGDLADFVRDCAARAMSGPQPMGSQDDGVTTLVTLPDLTRTYAHLRKASGKSALPGYVTERQLAAVLNHTTVDQLQDALLGTWLTRLTSALDLVAIAAASPAQRDQQALARFHQADRQHALTVADIAAGSLRTGKVTLTTYHSAKGRGWDVIILPGLVEGIMPRWTWYRPYRTYVQPPPGELEQDRRAFYVGLTRAKDAVILIHGTYWETEWGARNTVGTGTSRFVLDVLSHLDGAVSPRR
jgi:DNA helicase-2/ATP-dependent DNA helicase PcrA